MGTNIIYRAGYSHNTFGLLYPDLASNILGSFIMGFLVADSTPKAVAFLPPWHIWQVSPMHAQNTDISILPPTCILQCCRYDLSACIWLHLTYNLRALQ